MDKSMIRKSFYVLLAVMFTGIPAYLGMYFIYPDVEKLKKENPVRTSFMKYREDEWRSQGKHIKIMQEWVRLPRIAPCVVKAVIISEDDKFWHHDGFDYDALQKAIEQDIKKRKLKVGGSTISQQLAKNLYLSPSKNPIRKIKEAILTWRIEKALSKKRIIELYLNIAEWGEGIFGIEAASRHYFGKPASALSAREAAQLAAVLPNPRRYHPLGASRFVRTRSERIYRIMVQRGIVIPEYEAVMNEPAEVDPGESASSEAFRPLPNPEDMPDQGIKESNSEKATEQDGGEGKQFPPMDRGDESGETEKPGVSP